MPKIINKILVAASLLYITAAPSNAQLAGLIPGSSEPAAIEQPADIYGRETPRTMMSGFMEALASNDYDRAAHYLEVPEKNGSQITRDLETVLTRAGALVSVRELSSDKMGRINDGLPENQETVGTIKTADQSYPIIAIRTELDGAMLWRISHESTKALPALLDTTSEGLVTRWMPDGIPDIKISNVPASHWAFTISFIFGMWLLFTLASRLTFALFGFIKRGAQGTFFTFLSFTRPAIVAMLTCAAVPPFLAYSGVSVILRGYSTQFLSVVWAISIAWLLLRAVHVVAEMVISHAVSRDHTGSISFLVLIRRIAKSLIVFVAIILVLDAFGINLTAGLAALGIGGIAIALGSQKTIEHFVGSLTVIADRPVSIGHLCRFGTIIGVVEDIGMRSTLLRTPERTLVSIPNGVFSSAEIENYSARDKYLIKQHIPLQSGCTAKDIRKVLESIRSGIKYRPEVDQDTVRIRLNSFLAGLPIIEIFVYVYAKDIPQYHERQEYVLLTVMDAIEEAGFKVGIPSQQLHHHEALPSVAPITPEITPEQSA